MLQRFMCATILVGALCIATSGGAQDKHSFESSGVLVSGVECILFRADVGGVYLLEDYGDFGVGDRVRVKGVLDQACFTICMEGNGCIRSNSISPSQVMPVEATTWSRVKALYGE